MDIDNVSDSTTGRVARPSKLSFGFLGLGNMGTGIVKNLINSGHKINLWNRTSGKVSLFKNIYIKK